MKWPKGNPRKSENNRVIAAVASPLRRYPNQHYALVFSSRHPRSLGRLIEVGVLLEDRSFSPVPEVPMPSRVKLRFEKVMMATRVEDHEDYPGSSDELIPDLYRC